MLFFILCIAIGVGAVMTVKSFSNLMGQAIQGQAKGLLSADLAIKGSWEQTLEDLDYQEKILPPETEFLFIKELHGMAQFKSTKTGEKPASLITELKAVPLTGPQYPFYGDFKNQPEKPLTELLAHGGAVVEPSFLLKTDLKLGDTFSLGKAEMRITAVVLSEPDRISRAFSIGPRVFISRTSLDKSGLVQPGSRIKHRTLIRLPADFELEKALVLLERGLKDKSISIRTYKDMQSSLSGRTGSHRSSHGGDRCGHDCPHLHVTETRYTGDLELSWRFVQDLVQSVSPPVHADGPGRQYYRCEPRIRSHIPASS